MPVVWFTIKILGFLYFFIWIRATLPRLRYDMLMKFGWQGILPIALVNILLLAVGIAVNYGVALAAWAVVFAISLVLLRQKQAVAALHDQLAPERDDPAVLQRTAVPRCRRESRQRRADTAAGCQDRRLPGCHDRARSGRRRRRADETERLISHEPQG